MSRVLSSSYPFLESFVSLALWTAEGFLERERETGGYKREEIAGGRLHGPRVHPGRRELYYVWIAMRART